MSLNLLAIKHKAPEKTFTEKQKLDMQYTFRKQLFQIVVYLAFTSILYIFLIDFLIAISDILFLFSKIQITDASCRKYYCKETNSFNISILVGNTTTKKHTVPIFQY